ncbi:phosphoglycolate phosphatase [Stenotrophomonas pictorum JCM 9942]|jgi:2-phosphoglycolate phosphatase|uniref:Phosphoglycolate phosphatase n=1 Tax=Stenotrophomonas pictorum JCM 9942 TaxID=1236960 RepID=A0A0R0AD86_9GAMM|nr:phosphoglycolate phosphatase [Stenotrophomonas pictorum]KRG42693.1 phosphoglycolate phosphatase [Stenotrophomonas pictorum JCM 9942]
MTSAAFPAAVLFDLDGTLLDSAPDFVATANRMREARQMPPVAPEQLRPVVSKGSRAMLEVAFPQMAESERHALIPEFLDIYESLIGQYARLFDGIEPMLEALEQAGARWGIVTNKPEYLARLIVPQLGWEQRCAVLIGGDTLAERKPHPLPLQVAAQRIGMAVTSCVYVGDDERDIVAARAAGMPSVAALWGYRLDDDDPATWEANRICTLPHELCQPAAWPTVYRASV